jgi:hypothetical protein
MYIEVNHGHLFDRRRVFSKRVQSTDRDVVENAETTRNSVRFEAVRAGMVAGWSDTAESVAVSAIDYSVNCGDD